MEQVLSIPSATGVDLNLRIAGPGARSYAFIIDWHIRFLVAAAWLLIGTLMVGTSGAVFMFAVIIPAAVIYFLYHPILEIAMGGRTPGKRMAHVRVIDAEGGAPGIGALLTRNIFRLIDSQPLVYCIGLGFTLFTKHSVRIGDLAAGTLLVYDETKDETLEDLAGADLGRLGIERAEIVRDLLARWQDLAPDTRRRLALKLLTSLGVAHEGGDADLRAALQATLTTRDDQP